MITFESIVNDKSIELVEIANEIKTKSNYSNDEDLRRFIRDDIGEFEIIDMDDYTDEYSDIEDQLIEFIYAIIKGA